MAHGLSLALCWRSCPADLASRPIPSRSPRSGSSRPSGELEQVRARQAAEKKAAKKAKRAEKARRAENKARADRRQLAIDTLTGIARDEDAPAQARIDAAQKLTAF